VVVIANAGSVGTGDVLLVADTGATVTLGNGFSYGPQASIINANPPQGQYGTVVVIVGTFMLGQGQDIVSVTLDGVEVHAITLSGDFVLTVVAARGNVSSTPGDVVVTSNTGSFVVGASKFSYLEEGVITSVFPSSGQVGTYVTITGERLFGGGTALDSVSLNGLDVDEIVLANNTIVVVRASASLNATIGTVKLISNLLSIVEEENAFEYLEQGVISDATPSHGQKGTTVTISGLRMLGGGATLDSIQLGGVEVLQVLNISNDQVIVRADYSAVVGPVDVDLVADTGARLTLEDGWNYREAANISEIVPTSGHYGTIVEIVGEGFLAGGESDAIATVHLGGIQAVISNFTNTSIFVVAQASTSALTGDVVVVATSGAITTLENGWTYVQAGNITSVTPAFGHVGTRVTIEGTNLLGGSVDIASVFLADVASDIISATNTKIIVAASESVDRNGTVLLVAQSGAEVSGLNWEYREQGVILQISPNSGQRDTVVTINGTHLRGHGDEVVRVTLDSVEATIVSETNELVQVIAGDSSTAQVGDVIVISDSGSQVTLESGWEYLATGVITSVLPSSGQYQTRVTISGTNLLGHGSRTDNVSFGGVSVTDIFEQNSTHVVVAIDDTSVGVVDILIVSDTGATVTAASAFTFLQPGEISSIDPSSGREGTLVQILGQRLCGGGAEVVQVTLAGLDATIVGRDACGLVRVTAHDFGAAVTGDVLLTSDTGAVVTRTNGCTYVVEGEIDTVAPDAGQANTVVTITGDRLLGGGTSADTVELANVSAFIISSSATEVVVRTFPAPQLRVML